MLIRIKEMSGPVESEIDLPAVPRSYDWLVLDDGTVRRIINITWESGRPPLLVYRSDAI